LKQNVTGSIPVAAAKESKMETLRDLVVRLMSPLLANRVLQFHDDHVEEIAVAHGSSHNHQAWPGGYQDHIVQCLTLAESQHELLSNYMIPNGLPFRVSEAALVLYFHDIEKIFKYGKKSHKYHSKQITDKNIWYYGIIPEKYDIHFSDDELNALEYVHGEHDYVGTERKMRPLAAFCHCVDVMSARIFHDIKVLRR